MIKSSSPELKDCDTYPSNIKLYNKQSIIGRGAFGSVWDAIVTIGPHMNEYVAVKEVDLEEMGDKLNEISLMSSLNHPNLIKTLQTCTSGHKIYIIMPLMDGGSLSSIINFKYPNGIKDENIIATIMKICLETLEYLHERKYMHRDIKSGNILLNKNGLITLGDFGVATKIKNEAKKKSFVGSLNWMPPEVLSNEGYDHKFDIWSLGITAIEIAQGKPPFFNFGELDIIRKVQLEEPPKLKDPLKWDPLFINFIKSCLVKNPQKRPTAAELLEANKEFFLKAKDNQYLKETLLKGVPSVKERFNNVRLMYDETKVDVDSLNNNIISPMKQKINWNFNSLNNYIKKEDCNVEDETDISEVNQSHIGNLSRLSSTNFKFMDNTLVKTGSSTSITCKSEFNINRMNSFHKNNTMDSSSQNVSLRKDIKTFTSKPSQKVKMNPEIEEALKKKELNDNIVRTKKVESIKKCFDGDEDR